MIKLEVWRGRLAVHVDNIHDEWLRSHYREMKGTKEDGGLVLLVGQSEHGEAITCGWPDYDLKNLRTLLYQGRETGVFARDAAEVILPDDTVVTVEPSEEEIREELEYALAGDLDMGPDAREALNETLKPIRRERRMELIDELIALGENTACHKLGEVVWEDYKEAHGG